jgi:quercetin dioxygenase-like cupin family protein
MRGIARGLAGTNVALGLVHIPVGQETPDHYYTGEHLIFQLTGSTRFTVGTEVIVLREHDVIFLPADVTYRYASVGLVPSTFVNVLGRTGEWPATSHYV